MPSLTKVQSGFLDDSSQFTTGSLLVTGAQEINISDSTSFNPTSGPVYPTNSDLLRLINPDQTTDGYTGIYFQHKSSNVAWGRIALHGNFFGDPQHAFVFTMRGGSGVSNNEKFRIGNSGTIHFKADLDTYITGDGSDAIQVYTAGNEKLRITSDGKLGIGTTSPGQLLDISGSNAATRITNTNSGAASAVVFGNDLGISPCQVFLNGSTKSSFGGPGAFNIYQGANAPILFSTNDIERGRIDNDGRLLVGTSSARSNFTGVSSPIIQSTGDVNKTPSIGLVTGDGAGNPQSYLIFGRTADGGTGNNLVGNNFKLGSISFQGANGSNLVPAAEISAITDGTPSANSMPGRLVFRTTGDGSSTPTERMRITKDGNVGIGTSSPETTLDISGIVRLRENTDTPEYARIDLFTTNNNNSSIYTFSANYSGVNYANSLVFTVPQKVIARPNITTGGAFEVWTGGSSNTGYRPFKLYTESHPSIATMVIGHYDQTGSSSGRTGKIIGPSGAGTDVNGGTLALCGGESTGTGSGGPIVFRTSEPGSTGTTVNTGQERLRITSTGDVGIGTSNPIARLHVFKPGELAGDTAALYVETGNENSQSAVSPQYGIKVKQLGGRYDLQYGIYSEVAGDNGFYGGDTTEGFSTLRGIGVYGYSPCSSQAYQAAHGVYGKSEQSGWNYNTIIGVRGLALPATGTAGDFNNNSQRGYGGHFVAHGNANSCGVYADAYLDASPGTNHTARPLVVATNGSEFIHATDDKYLRMLSGSGGIQFNGDTAAANALDDYEEGTWTVQFYDAASGGNLSSTTTTGHYTKIGNVVTASFAAIVNIQTTGMTSGNAALFTLPFACGSGKETTAAFVCNLTFTGSIGAQTLGGSARAYFTSYSSSGVANLTVSAISGKAIQRFSITYKT